MATENNTGDDLSINAGADLSTGAQYHIVKGDGAGNVVLAAAATDRPVGILQNNPKQNRVAAVRPVGVSKAVCGAAVAADDLLTSDGTGRVITASAGNRVVGRAKTAGAAAGIVISVDMERSTA